MVEPLAGALRRDERQTLARRPRDRRRSRRRIVHSRHVDRHGVGRRALQNAVAHLEGERGVGVAMAVRRRLEGQLAEVRRRDDLVRARRRRPAPASPPTATS